MPSPAVDHLLALGITQHQARSYEALWGLGEAGAYAVARAANLPAANTYAALDALVKQGGARLLPGRPRRFRAAAPEVWLPALAASLQDRAQSAARSLQAQRSAAVDPGQEGELHGSQILQRMLRTRLERSGSRVVAALPAGDLGRWQRPLVEAGSRGVQVAVLARGDDLTFAPPVGWLLVRDEVARDEDSGSLWVLDGAAIRWNGDGQAARGRVLEDALYANALAGGILARIGWVLACARAAGQPAREEQRATRLFQEPFGA